MNLKLRILELPDVPAMSPSKARFAVIPVLTKQLGTTNSLTITQQTSYVETWEIQNTRVCIHR